MLQVSPCLKKIGSYQADKEKRAAVNTRGHLLPEKQFTFMLQMVTVNTLQSSRKWNQNEGSLS